MSRRADSRPGDRPVRLSPQQVRAATFTAAPRRRGGLHPDEVYAFLHRVADEMARLHRELAAATDDAIRVKTALHQWQVEHAATCTQPPPGGRPTPQRPPHSPWAGPDTTNPADPRRRPGHPPGRGNRGGATGCCLAGLGGAGPGCREAGPAQPFAGSGYARRCPTVPAVQEPSAAAGPSWRHCRRSHPPALAVALPK